MWLPYLACLVALLSLKFACDAQTTTLMTPQPSETIISDSSTPRSSTTLLEALSTLSTSTATMAPSASRTPTPTTSTLVSSSTTGITESQSSMTPMRSSPMRISSMTPMRSDAGSTSTLSSMPSSISVSTYVFVPSSASITPSSTSHPVAPSSTSIPMPAPTQPGPKKFQFSFKIENEVCSNALKENIVTDSSYKVMANQIISGVKSAFSGDKTFRSARIVRFECGSVIAVVEVSKSVNANGTAAQELSPVSNQINNGTFAGYTTSTFSTSPSAPSLPSLYITLKLTLSNKQFCANKEIFKKSFAAILVSSNGYSFVQPTQIVVAEHKCNDPATTATIKASPILYISGSASDASTPDTELTTRANALIKQFIDDGTTWRLSAAFDKKVSSATLGGSAKPKDDSLSELTRVGIGTGVTFGVLLIVLIIVLVCTRNRHTDEERYPAVTIGNEAYTGEMQQVHSYAAVNDGYDGEVKETKITVGEHDYEYPDAPANEKPSNSNPKESYQELQGNNANQSKPTYEPLTAAEEEYLVVKAEPDVKNQRHSVSLDELSHRKDNDQGMREEFETLEYNMPSSNVYPEQASDKNRLANVVPRPETRVILSSLSDQPGSDYINANFVKDQHQKKSYILTQSPLQNTAQDFWRMIHEQNISVIVMVTPLVQLGVEKCYQYWPADSVAKNYGDIEVQLKKKELKPDFTITTMSLKNKDETRDVILYRYMTWPENNIPENAKTFVTFLLEAKNASGSDDGKIMVAHCSDGVGMSASLVAIDIGIQSLKEKRSVDVHSIVKGIRKDRAGAIQVFDQYKFIYRALHEYVVHHGAGQDAFANDADATSSM